MKIITFSHIDTPLGIMTIGATKKGICLLNFGKKDNSDKLSNYQFVKGTNSFIKKLNIQLNEYFNKKRFNFDIEIDLIGTPFQIKVWEELLNMPYGVTKSYKEQAIAVGNLKAIRAVASANGSNNIAVVVPCHRVIGSNGSLTGFSGGLLKKKFLLELESNQIKLF